MKLLNLVPIAKSSLIATKSRACRGGWLKPTFIAALKWQWASSNCKTHSEQLNKQLDDFNWSIHCDLYSLSSMLKQHVGLEGRDFYSRVVFTDRPQDSHYKYWHIIGSSCATGKDKLLSFRLYESPTNPNKMAIVFETVNGLFGKAAWDFDKLEIFSEEMFSELTRAPDFLG
ncbi:MULTISPECIES: hypothetical protein [Vibrio]|uniref:Uncharacterized protein n=1 Tax=Vibrio cholerae TaxID=666 RepID=A0A7Z7VM91_VIBCL|nr:MULTISPECIES: hypothetical protein [Vibrio]TBM39653.1 hypothetical protein EYB64_16455 [Vibrio cholerae]